MEIAQNGIISSIMDFKEQVLCEAPLTLTAPAETNGTQISLVASTEWEGRQTHRSTTLLQLDTVDYWLLNCPKPRLQR